MKLSELPGRLAAALWPPRCLLCGGVVPYDDFLCEECVLPPVGQVALPFAHGMAGVVALTRYSGDLRRLIWQVKDAKNKRVYGLLAREMHAAISAHWGGAHFDVIVPVPGKASKIKERGYNHVDLLAAPLGRLTGLPVCADALMRLEHSDIQHELAGARRRGNAEKSYAARTPRAVEGKTVLLLDDLLTTGSTMAACARRLAESGAAAVYGLAAAYTPPRGGA